MSVAAEPLGSRRSRASGYNDYPELLNVYEAARFDRTA